MDRTEKLREALARELQRQGVINLYSHWDIDPKRNKVWFERADKLLRLLKEHGMVFKDGYIPMDLHKGNLGELDLRE